LDKAVYIPSLFELEEYCKTAKYKKCPLIRGKVYGNDEFASLNKMEKGIARKL